MRKCGGNGNTLCLDYGQYTTLYICQNSQIRSQKGGDFTICKLHLDEPDFKKNASWQVFTMAGNVVESEKRTL